MFDHVSGPKPREVDLRSERKAVRSSEPLYNFSPEDVECLVAYYQRRLQRYRREVGLGSATMDEQALLAIHDTKALLRDLQKSLPPNRRHAIEALINSA